MNHIPLSILFSALILLILVSAFFSASETAMMALNRYRLRHLANKKHPGALRASRLLERPDRLIGLILLGNNFANVMASSLTTIITLRIMGDAWIAAAAGILTFVILIFAEVGPKTLAALHPERIAFPVSLILGPLLTIFYPVVWLTNLIASIFLKPLGVSPSDNALQKLSSEELRTVVLEAGTLIPEKHQKMLINILDMEKVKVDDIMIPKNEIVGIDINDDLDIIINYLTCTQHTRLPIYRDSIDHVIAILHVRNVLPLLTQKEITKDSLLAVAHEPYFIPSGTPLNRQLLNYQHQEQRLALIVDEYGDIEGLAALDDILEEIVGEFTTDYYTNIKDVYPQEDGSYLVEGTINIRSLNRMMHWDLPTNGPKTLNGLIIEYLESIPEPGTSLRLEGYVIEIVQTSDNAVKSAKIRPAPKPQPHPNDT